MSPYILHSDLLYTKYRGAIYKAVNRSTDEPELAITTFLHSIRSSTSIFFLFCSSSLPPLFFKTIPFIALLIRPGGTPAACDDEVTFFSR